MIKRKVKCGPAWQCPICARNDPRRRLPANVRHAINVLFSFFRSDHGRAFVQRQNGRAS